MADSHLQVNSDGTTITRKTELWPSSKQSQQEILRSIFEQHNWKVSRLENINGSYWKVETSSAIFSWKINLYISSIRDESRQPDEFKMQLGSSYPKSEEPGWLNIVMGIYTISDGIHPTEYILSGYNISRYDFSTNPSIRGTRTKGLQKAKLFGMYITDKSVLFRPEFLYYYIESQANVKLHSNEIDDKSELIGNSLLRYLTAIRTKPFVLLAGISGTGKSRIVRKLAQATVTEELQVAYGNKYTSFEEERWNIHKPENFEIIQVKPNWHNSMDVVGYLSNIPEPHYVFTPFVEFIIKAMKYPTIPFFLCLDEMNLAPVEEYFAEFLSAIESRSYEKGEYSTDPIIKSFGSFGKDVCEQMISTLFPEQSSDGDDIEVLKNKLKTKGLSLPQNLIVIGTVNMDETTFSFSRKVLDRAMSIEMNDVDYDSYLNGTTDNELKSLLETFDTDELNSLLVERPVNSSNIIEELGNGGDISDSQFVIDYLKNINALFDGTPFKLGYRAANEALLYLSASYKFKSGDRVKAMDNFTLMKILSRIEGDESKLKLTDSKVDKDRLEKAAVKIENAKKYGDLTILTAMRELIKSSLLKYPDIDSDTRNENQETNNANTLNSIKKIDSMISQLERDHFVSYWN